MKIKRYKTLEGTVMELDGMLDSSSFDEFNSEVAAFLSSGGYLALTVDLTKLEYISSRGIRAILTLIKKMKELGQPLAFKGITPAVKEIFDLTGLTSIMNFVD